MSESSKIILLQSPIIGCVENRNLAQSSNIGLEPISESGDMVPPDTQDSQANVHRTPTYDEDPWLVPEENTTYPTYTPHTPRRVQSYQAAKFDYGALMWRSIIEGGDPWNES